MIDVLTLAGSKILSIPDMEPERLFGRPDLVHDRYKSLAKKWHPDNKDTGHNGVFQHINILHEKAKKLVEEGKWHVPGELSFKTKAGKEYVLRYFKSFDFDLGKAYLSDTRITYVFRKEFADLAENANKMIEGLKYPDKKTEEVMVRYMPSIKGYYETADEVIMMIDKPSDLIRMRDLLEFSKGKVDPKHVAWMLSRMFHHASYFEVTQFSHQDLSLDTLFVCPEHHTVCVLGGWWYATPFGRKPIALPSRTINNAPSELLAEKLAMRGTDSELIKLTARELLGNANGIHLVLDKEIPSQMTNWLRISGKRSAIDDYTQWREKVVLDSFGKRKFRIMPISAKDVYTP
jgi:hypothetical protein